MKGNPGCFGGKFRKFETLEEGIEAFIKLFSTWAAKVINYINQVKEA